MTTTMMMVVKVTQQPMVNLRHHNNGPVKP